MPYHLDVKATRAGLFQVRIKQRMATKAHRILSMKLDGLILEVTRLAPEVKKEYDLLIERYNRVRHLIVPAYMIEGTVGVRVAAYSVEVKPEISLSVKNVFGVMVPVITGTDVQTDLTERGYGLLGTTLVIDDLADAYEDLLAAIIAYIGSEATLKHILMEIERINRRVKALEHMVIPALDDAVLSISQARDEIEREDLSRLFHVKKRKKELIEAEEEVRKKMDQIP
ncbi:MAG TPA: V-type ATP synthase subunit D [Methanospirillum sp.]|nr:V-type ATP synthase subunit D [Methanospirillum sp.]